MAKKLALELRNRINYSRSVSVNYKTLKIIGVKYMKTNDRHKLLMEREDTVSIHNLRIIFQTKHGLTTITNTFGRTLQDREVRQFLQEKEAGSFYASKDQRKRLYS
jgi:hypothetical protein